MDRGGGRGMSTKRPQAEGGTEEEDQNEHKTGTGAEGGQTPGHKNSPKQVQGLRGDRGEGPK